MKWTSRCPLPATRVIRSQSRIIEWRGKPDTIRVDKGPEYISSSLREWAEDQGIALQHIQPAKLQQKAYMPRPTGDCNGIAEREPYNCTVQHEWLDQYMFASIEEVQDHATEWL